MAKNFPILKVSGYKINMQKSVLFLYIKNKLSVKEMHKNNPIFNCIKKNNILRNTSNQDRERPLHWKSEDIDEINFKRHR